MFDSLKITTSYLSFYCFKVLFLNLKRNFSRIVCVSLFSYQGSLFVCLSDSSFTLSHSSELVKHFFKFFFEAFLMFVRRSQATRLLYHIFISLSTTFFVFFKTFQIVYSEETILRDSSVRITLSNRAVNTFFKKS